MASQIAAQLYTLRDFCKTPADIAATFKKVKAIGYDAVQCSGMGKIDAKELASILKNEGLTCCVTHIGMDRMKADPEGVVADHKLWNCPYTAIGGFGWGTEMTTAKWIELAKDYSAVASTLSKLGLSAGYHNHSHELARYDGKTAMQIMLETFDKSVWFEIDTYWITHGGGDPIAWIEKCTGRVPCIHVKDMAITADQKQKMAPVGEGNLNFPGILAAAKKAGTKWFIVEQDDCYGRDPFDCLASSLKYLKSLGLN